MVETLKVATVARPRTETEAGAVRRLLLLVTVIEAPVGGVALARAKVHNELLELPREVGRQDRTPSPAAGVAVTNPPTLEIPSTSPAGDTATALPTPIAAVALTTRLTLATIPLATLTAFEPDKTQLRVPGPELQTRDLPAAVAAAPGVAEMLTRLAAGKVIVHSRPAGSLPLGEFSVRPSDALPSDAATAELMVRESVCAKQA